MTTESSQRRTEYGLTLIELIVSIVIISIAVVGVLGVMTYTSARSGDPMVTQQAVDIARSYLEEILLQPFSDPSGTATREADRSVYNDVDDYNGLHDVGARDQSSPGTVISGLGNYTISVTVQSRAFDGIPSTDAKLITVTVTGPGGATVSLSGYRTNY